MNLNKVFLIGRMAADPEARTTPSGQQVATLRVATNRVWNKDGQKQEAVEFHTVVCWGGLADVAGKYLKKGQMAFFEGRLQTRSWQGNDGVKRYRTEVVAESLQLGPKAAGFAEPGGNRPNGKTAAAADKKEDTDDIPVIEENTPLSNPLGKEESVEEAEIDL